MLVEAESDVRTSILGAIEREEMDSAIAATRCRRRSATCPSGCPRRWVHGGRRPPCSMRATGVLDRAEPRAYPPEETDSAIDDAETSLRPPGHADGHGAVDDMGSAKAELPFHTNRLFVVDGRQSVDRRDRTGRHCSLHDPAAPVASVHERQATSAGSGPNDEGGRGRRRHSTGTILCLGAHRRRPAES